MVDPELKTELPGRHIYDHEIFLSFNDDRDAELFYEWWNGEGKLSFVEFVKTVDGE